MAGRLISIEGGDGSGKSGQVKLLFERLQDEGYPVVRTREPGGSPSAEELRNLVVMGEPDRFCGMSELLLMTAARVEHLRQLIMPSIAAGKTVITDRMVGSTLAYQGYGRGLPLTDIEAIHRIACNGYQPDLTLFIDLDPTIALGRSWKRLTVQESSENRFERVDEDFHRRVYFGFKEMAVRQAPAWVVIDGTGSMEEVHERVIAAVTERFPDLQILSQLPRME